MDLASLVQIEATNSLISDNKETDAGISMEEAFNAINPASSVFTDTVYIICEKKNFRTDALLTIFSNEYKTKVIYTSTDGIPEINDPICFVVDVTSTESKLAQKIIYYIQDVAYEKNKHIFLIGEIEDLKNARPFFTRKDISVTEFARPIDINQTIDDIKEIISVPPRTVRRKQVVVCDDSLTFIKLLKKTLEKRYEVFTAQSAFDCIKILAGMDPPDMVIIDFEMPTCDGMTLCSMIKERPEYKNTAIVFYSGNSDVDNIIHLMPMIDGYILKDKPVTRLDTELEEIFRKKKKERKSKKEKKEKKNKGK